MNQTGHAGSQIKFLCIIANWSTEILRLLAQVKMTRAARGVGGLFPLPPRKFVFFKPNPAFYTHF
jgi:hypothetical protein